MMTDASRLAPTEDSGVLLSVRDLSIDYHLRTHILHAVREVSFDLHRGRTMALVGESGSGKSVTARALLRIIDTPARVTSGTITLNGPNGAERLDQMKETGKEIRAIRGGRIGLIFQEPMSSLSPVRTIGAQIVESLLLHRNMTKAEAKEETVRLLEQVEIKNPRQMADRYTFEFSGGMRQRAMIAMALACDPDVLIADEPTTALDVTIQAQILELMADLQSRLGMAVIWITHDLGVIAGIADRVLVMYGGQIVEQAPVRELFANPRHPYTAALLKTVPKVSGEREARLTIIEGQPPMLTAHPTACPFRDRCAHAFDRCERENPARYTVGDGHDAACFKAESGDVMPEAAHA